MTAAETLEYAQTSVDQLERGIGFVQDRLQQAENVAIKVDELAVTAGDVAAKARRGSRNALIVLGVIVVGGAVFFAVRKRAARTPTQKPDEPATEEVAG
jgi:hypothetical protein